MPKWCKADQRLAYAVKGAFMFPSTILQIKNFILQPKSNETLPDNKKRSNVKME